MLIVSLINLFTVCNRVLTGVISVVMLSLYIADMYNLIPETIELKRKPKDKYDTWEIEYDVKLNKWFVRTKAKNKAKGHQYIQHLTGLGEYQLYDKRKEHGKDTHEEALKLLDDYLCSLVEDIRVYPIKPKLDNNLKQN